MPSDTLDSGDTAWIQFHLISICWLIFGYSIAHGDRCRGLRCNEMNCVVGGSEKFWLWVTVTHGVEDISGYKNMLSKAMHNTIPESVFIMFQLTFTIIT